MMKNIKEIVILGSNERNTEFFARHKILRDYWVAVFRKTEQ
jgi:hypothetical protein